MLKWARYHLEQLDILEREFRAWERTQTPDCTVSIEVAVMSRSALLPLAPAAQAERARFGMSGTTRVNAARVRWEARVKARG